MGYALQFNTMLTDCNSHITESKPERLLKALIGISQELSSTNELEEILERILSAAREVFRFENAIIRLVDASGDQLIAAASYGYDEAARQQVIRVGQGVMGRCAALCEPVLVEDVRTRPDYVAGIPGARCELAVPLVAREKLVGVFNVESPRPDAFSRADIEPLLVLGRQAAISIENARLYQGLRTMTDEYRQLNDLNERILKGVSLGIYTVDQDLRITSWNRKMTEMSGLPASEAIGTLLPERFPVLAEEGVLERLREVLATGKKAKLRLLHRNLDGTFRFQKRRLAPLFDGETVTGAVVMVEDITEFKRLLEQTVHSEKLAEIGRLTAGIAHEINTPLSLVAYATELLRREGPLKPFQVEMVDKIEHEVGRLKCLTGGLLSFSSARESRHRPVDLSALANEALSLLRFELQRKAVQFETSFAELPLITADPNKLKQVLINLVMNAAQAIDKSGRIVISTTRPTEEMVELAVADDGCGMDEDLRKRIFEPFVTTKPEGEGTGLGLYICQNIIREHGGSITVESQPGQGTVFRVLLPAE